MYRRQKKKEKGKKFKGKITVQKWDSLTSPLYTTRNVHWKGTHKRQTKTYHCTSRPLLTVTRNLYTLLPCLWNVDWFLDTTTVDELYPSLKCSTIVWWRFVVPVPRRRNLLILHITVPIFEPPIGLSQYFTQLTITPNLTSFSFKCYDKMLPSLKRWGFGFLRGLIILFLQWSKVNKNVEIL